MLTVHKVTAIILLYHDIQKAADVTVPGVSGLLPSGSKPRRSSYESYRVTDFISQRC